MWQSQKKLSKVLMCIFLVCIWICIYGQDKPGWVEHRIDSLESLLNGMDDGNHKLKVLDEICFRHYNIDSTFKYASRLLDLAEKLHADYHIARANEFVGWYYFQMSDYVQSDSSYSNALHIYDSIHDDYGSAKCYYGLANLKSTFVGDIEADEYYLKALNLLELLSLDADAGEVYRRLAIIRIEYHLYEVANDLIEKAFSSDSARGDSSALAKDYFFSGYSLYKQYADFEMPYFLFSAKDNMMRGYELAIKYCELINVFWMSSELMFLYQDVAKLRSGVERYKSLDSALFFYNMTDSLINVCSDDEERVYLEMWNAKKHSIQGDYEQSLKILNDIESRSNILDEIIVELYKIMASTYESAGDYGNALKYIRLFNEKYRATFNRDFAVTATSGQYERELSHQELLRQKHRYTLLIMEICLVLISVIVLVFLFGLLRKRKLNGRLIEQNKEISLKNAILNESNAEIQTQREEIESQRDSLEETSLMLQSSINYAKHIQNAVVTSRETMNRMFGDTLIYWKPMNVVSGDFYWAFQRDNYKILAVADCTGHGVPGAFMSMFAISSLNSIVSPLSFTNIKASDVLDMLRAKVIGEFHQTAVNGDSIESVDMAFCIIDTNKMQLQYAGANRPLLIVRDGKINVYKPDKMPVGLHVKRNGPFTNNIIGLRNGDILYMYTDGITDQFGSDDENVANGKYTSKRLDNLLQNMAGKPFAEQAEILDKTITDWRTSSDNVMVEQYDDQLLLGIRIS